MKTLKIEELSKNFGTTEVLRKINLEIEEEKQKAGEDEGDR